MLPVALLVVSLASMDRHQLHVHHLQHMEQLYDERQERQARVAVSERRSGLSGTLGCNGLESLWESAGGSRAEAFVAAEVAMAESSGQQYATGPAGERGYWQIHPDHGSLSTYNPYGNARAAVIISNDGSNWSPWTTYNSGAYIGRC